MYKIIYLSNMCLKELLDRTNFHYPFTFVYTMCVFVLWCRLLPATHRNCGTRCFLLIKLFKLLMPL